MTAKFKMGSLVRCIEGNTKGSGWKLSKEFIVNSITNPDNTYIYFPVEGSGVFEDSLELVASKMFCSKCNFKSNCSSNCPNCGCNLVYEKENKFKVGDKVKYKGTKQGGEGDWEVYFGKYSIKKGDTAIIKDVYSNNENETRYFTEEDGRPNTSGYLLSIDLILQSECNSNQLNTQEDNMTEKKVYNVLVVNKKTGKVEKDATVTADSENQAILKAFKVDVENLVFTVLERATYTEDKPQTVVLESDKK